MVLRVSCTVTPTQVTRSPEVLGEAEGLPRLGPLTKKESACTAP